MYCHEQSQGLTDVIPFDSVLGRLEPQPNILIPSSTALSNTLALARGGALFVVEENVRLLLEGLFALHCEFCGHGCG